MTNLVYLIIKKIEITRRLIVQMQNAKNGTYKVIGDSLRQHPDNLIKKFDRDLVSKEKLMNGSRALVHVSRKTIILFKCASGLNVK